MKSAGVSHTVLFLCTHIVVQRGQCEDLLRSNNSNKHALASEVNVDIAKTEKELLDTEKKRPEGGGKTDSKTREEEVDDVKVTG